MSKTYRSGDFLITDHGGEWNVRIGSTIEKHGDCIVAEMISFSPQTGAKYAVMYQFPEAKILIEL